MKRLAPFGLILLAPGLAHAGTGYMDSSYFRTNTDTQAESGLVTGVESDSDRIAISGAWASEIRGLIQMQIDGLALYSDNDVDDQVYGVTAHIVSREKGSAYGAFLGAVDYDVTTLYAAGVEGGLYFKRGTLAGALAYAVGEADDEIIFGQAQYRHFFMRNLRADATLGYGKAKAGSIDTNLIQFGGGLEYRIYRTPLSIFSTYNYIVADIDSKTNAAQTTEIVDGENQVARIGFRYNFDANLAERDESGASMISVPELFSSIYR